MPSYPEFQANSKFLEYLKQLHDNPDLKESLKRQDFSGLLVQPGLSERERAFLKMVDWDNFEINPAPNLEPILTEAGQACEESAGPLFVERRCWQT
ncbi:hypothetical protein [Gimesia chilikensis]|uniref:hypothetical protein n=1 Tax=Gimesia chilikensis TaxID=2605989 RepID=UPI003A948DB2